MTMKVRYLALSLFGVMLASGCATQQVVVNTAFDFSKVRRISVQPFEGPGGAAATDEFVKQLVGTGLEVTDARHPGELILKGSVMDYKSNNQLMVFLGGDNPIVTSSAQVTPEEAAAGAHKTQVASVMASVAIQVRLMEASSRTIVWADSYSYEGLDLAAALQAVVGALKQSMGRPLPQVIQRNPT